MQKLRETKGGDRDKDLGKIKNKMTGNRSYHSKAIKKIEAASRPTRSKMIVKRK